MSKLIVSIPSNGPIQFLHSDIEKVLYKSYNGLNPLKRVNSILTASKDKQFIGTLIESQSPQTGQFNSYDLGGYNENKEGSSLNPLKRVNSILTNMDYIV